MASAAGCSTSIKAATNAFDWRWTVRALVKAGVLPSFVRHYNLQLYELLFDLSEKLHGEGGGARVLPGWRRTKLMKKHVVRHGVGYGLEVQRIGGGSSGGGAGGETDGGGESSSLSGGSASTGRGEGAWLAEQLGSPTRLRTRPTTEDMEALLAADVNVADGRAVSALALGRGLHVPAAMASKFGEAVLADERAWQVVEAAGYRALLQRLHTRAEVRPTATLPERGATIGSMALPAPQPALAPDVEMEQVALPPAPAPAPASAPAPAPAPTAAPRPAPGPTAASSGKKWKNAHRDWDELSEAEQAEEAAKKGKTLISMETIRRKEDQRRAKRDADDALRATESKQRMALQAATKAAAVALRTAAAPTAAAPTAAPTVAPTAAPMAAPAAAPAAAAPAAAPPAMAASPGRLRAAAAALGLERWL